MPPLGPRGREGVERERTRVRPPVSGEIETTVEKAVAEEKARECQLESIIGTARDQGKTVTCVMSWYFSWVWWDGMHESEASVSGKVAYDPQSDALAGRLSDYNVPQIRSLLFNQFVQWDPTIFIPCLITIERDGTVTTEREGGEPSPGGTPHSWRGSCVGATLLGTFRYDWDTWRVELTVD
jgi:hypothetical protein